MGRNMVAAAKAAGVRKFVFSSVIHPSISTMVNHAAKQPVEQALYESGLDYTILQPAMFMQILSGAWLSILETGTITMPYSKRAKMSYVDFRDVAEVAGRAFVDDDLSYGTYELCAPGMVSRLEMATLIGDALGRTITADEVNPNLWAATVSIPAGFFRYGLIAMNAHYNQYGLAGGNALVLRATLGREPRTLAQYFVELAIRTSPTASDGGESDEAKRRLQCSHDRGVPRKPRESRRPVRRSAVAPTAQHWRPLRGRAHQPDDVPTRRRPIPGVRVQSRVRSQP